MNKRQARIEPAFAVFPSSTAFFQPGKTALNQPICRHDLKGVSLSPLDKLYPHVLTENVSYTLDKRGSDIATITQNTFCPNPVWLRFNANSAPWRPVTSAVATDSA